MAKIHKYDMSRRLDNGKWEVVGKGYQDTQTDCLTVWIEPDKMVKIIKGQKEGVPFILFDKAPAPVTEPVKIPVPDRRKAHLPTTAEHMEQFTKEDRLQRTKHFEPKAKMPPPIVAKASDDWPPEFDDDTPFS